MNLHPIRVILTVTYACSVGFLVSQRAWGAAAAVFTYGLGLALGCIYDAAQSTRKVWE